MQQTVRYFSMFSGILGFEQGIDTAEGFLMSGFQLHTEQNLLQEGRDPDQCLLFEDKVEPLRGKPVRFECVGVCEIDQAASGVIAYLRPELKNYGDVTEIDEKVLPDFDMLVGGPPCQSFSISGARKGFEDTRGTMIFHVLRILKEKKPPYFILENVMGLLSHDGGQTLDVIAESLCELGYAIDFDCMNTKFFRLPQNRQRIYIVGKRLDLLKESEVF